MTIGQLNFGLLPRAILIHGRDEARLATGLGRPITFLSPPDAAVSWGCLWWRSLLTAANYQGPALLDCGTASGRAAEALAIGLKGIVLSACPGLSEIAHLATTTGAILLTTRPPALDLRLPHTENRLASWLNG
jgi:hypothetical protein